MSKYSGYMGKVSLLDLGTREVRDYPWSDEERELCIGGRAMAAKIMADCLKGSETALSEENIIVIATGPLTGTGAPCSNHFCIGSLSPVTGSASFASCGGDFGLYLKRAGFDALVIKGKSEAPVWVEIQNDVFTFNSAKDIKGLKTGKTQEVFRRVINEKRNCNVKCGTLAIGPAGENLVKFANVVSGEREAEHCDFGAVFGYKNLKGILAAGNLDITVADAVNAKVNNIDWSDILRSHPVTGNLLPKMGTLGFASYLNEQGMLPTKNYAKGAFEDIEAVSGETFADKYNVACRSCTYCPIRCERSAMLDGKIVRGPELDTASRLGSNILNSDAKLIIRWNNELMEYGLDATAAADTIAWAMEAKEAGVFKSELEFGITTNISAAIADIAYRRGIGDELAEGSKLLGEKYGTDFAYSMKPLELAAIDRYMGMSAKKNGETDKAALADFAEALQEAAASAGQCRMVNFADIPACVFTKPNGLASAAIKAVLPVSGTVFKLLSLLPEDVTAPLPHFVHTKSLKYALDMKLSMAQFIEAGSRGLKAEAELDEKFGFKKSKASMPASMAAAQKAAKKSIPEKLKGKIEELKNLEKEELPIIGKLLKKED